MKFFALILSLLFFMVNSHAQDTKLIKVQQNNTDIIITYSIPASTPMHLYQVKAYCLINKVDTFELKTVSGDIGDSIRGGKESYRLVWSVFDDLDELSAADYFISAKLINKEFIFSKIDSTEYRKNIEEEQIIQLAKSDAKTYYKSNGAIFCTGCSSAAFAPIGLIVATISSITEPQEDKLNMPYHEYYNNELYRETYIGEAHRLKKKRIWITTGTALAIQIPIIIAIFSQNN